MRKKKPVRAETNEELQGVEFKAPDKECMPPSPPRDPPRVKMPPSPGKVARQRLKEVMKYARKKLRKAEDLGAIALEQSELVKRIQQAKLREIAAPRGRGDSKKRGGSAVDPIKRMHAFHRCHHEMHVHEAVFYQTTLPCLPCLPRNRLMQCSWRSETKKSPCYRAPAAPAQEIANAHGHGVI